MKRKCHASCRQLSEKQIARKRVRRIERVRKCPQREKQLALRRAQRAKRERKSPQKRTKRLARTRKNAARRKEREQKYPRVRARRLERRRANAAQRVHRKRQRPRSRGKQISQSIVSRTQSDSRGRPKVRFRISKPALMLLRLAPTHDRRETYAKRVRLAKLAAMTKHANGNALDALELLARARNWETKRRLGTHSDAVSALLRLRYESVGTREPDSSLRKVFTTPACVSLSCDAIR